MPADFEKQSYWQERFASETAFEWLTTSATFMETAGAYLDTLDAGSARLLHLGSGTSDLHNHLRARGFGDVTNVDYEPRALERGQDLERARFGDVRTKYRVADATQLEPSAAGADAGAGGKYHAAIDKSTADAIACGEDGAVLAMARGIRRCLRDDGFWLSLSFSASRFDHVRALFDVELIAELPTPKHKPTDPDVFHYFYLLRPRPAS